ncbi:MAG: Gfo/Idh/MocA family oxidoreductase [Gammaproteobacteria bacterium]|nr:Gfo/Idh/MocA family oxidoreductase [Gammaproteobacteria bacterium]
MVDRVRIGILGTGRMARDFATGLRDAPDLELLAIGSRSEESAAQFGDEFGVARRFDDYATLAADPDLELVYIATPHAMHCHNSMMCLEAGKAVLCEKPFAINATESRQVVELARSKNLFLMEAMWTRYIPAIERLRELLADGAIGKPQLMVAGGAYMPDFDPDFYLFDPELGGGVLLDAGVYLVSIASMVFGSPEHILATGSLGPTGVDEHDSVLLTHADGSTAHLYVSLRARASPTVTLLGDRGQIFVHAPLFAPSRLTVTIDGKDETIELPFAGNGYQFQAIEAARCIRAGLTESPVMPLDETLAVMDSMDEIRRQIGLVYPMEK